MKRVITATAFVLTMAIFATAKPDRGVEPANGSKVYRSDVTTGWASVATLLHKNGQADLAVKAQEQTGKMADTPPGHGNFCRVNNVGMSFYAGHVLGKSWEPLEYAAQKYGACCGFVDGTFVTVLSVEGHAVRFIDHATGKTAERSHHEFLRWWTGSVMIIHPSVEDMEKNRFIPKERQ